MRERFCGAKVRCCDFSFNKIFEEIGIQILSIKKNVVILHPLSIVGEGRATYPFRPEVQYGKRKTQRCGLGAKSANLRYPSRRNGTRNPR